MVEIIERIIYINDLIRRKATGSRTDFARKLNISVGALHNTLNAMRHFGAPIAYSKSRESYYYTDEGYFFCGFKKSNKTVLETELVAEVTKVLEKYANEI